MSKRNRITVPRSSRRVDPPEIVIPTGAEVHFGRLFNVLEGHGETGVTSYLLEQPGAPPALMQARAQIALEIFRAIATDTRWYEDVAAVIDQAGLFNVLRRDALALVPAITARLYASDNDARVLVDQLAADLPPEWQHAARSWLPSILAEIVAPARINGAFDGPERAALFDDLVKAIAANILADLQLGNVPAPHASKPLAEQWRHVYRSAAQMGFELSRAHRTTYLADSAARYACTPESIRQTWGAIVQHFEKVYGPPRRRRGASKTKTSQAIAAPPATPTIAGGHYVTHALNPVTYAIGRAVSDGKAQRGWHDYNGATVPHHVTKTKTGGEIRISKRDETGDLEVSEAVRERLFEQLRSYGPRERNVFGSLIVLASARSEPFALPLWIQPENVLDVMGRIPITKPDEPASWSHGHRTEDKLEVCRALLALDDLHIELVDVEVKGRRGKTELLNRKGRVLVVTDAEERRPKEPGDMLTGGQRVRVVFGGWVNEFGETGLKQFGLISQKAISYGAPYETEGGLAWYLAFHFGYDRSGMGRPLRRKVGTLLEEAGLMQNDRYPIKTRNRLEAALKRLVTDGVLGQWEYTAEIEAILPTKNWAHTWHEATISLTPPPAIDDGYTALRDKRAGESTRQLPLTTAT